MKSIKRLASAALTLMCLFGSFASPAFSSENRHVLIINHASSSIRYLYASNVDENNWGEDLLGPLNVLLPNYQVDANIDDRTGHCLYDIKAVLYDGRSAVTRNLNVCSQSSWTVTD